MTKKNLSDLLKAEAQPSASPTPAADAPAAATPAADAPKSTAKSTPARTPRSTVTKADLESQVAALTADLAAAAQRETTLTAQVKGLQGDLETQQTRLFELKDALEKAEAEATAKNQQIEKVTAALAEAKQTILKMTEMAAAPPPPPRPPSRNPRLNPP